MTKGDILSPQPGKAEGKWWWVKGCVNGRHQMEGTYRGNKVVCKEQARKF